MNNETYLMIAIFSVILIILFIIIKKKQIYIEQITAQLNNLELVLNGYQVELNRLNISIENQLKRSSVDRNMIINLANSMREEDYEKIIRNLDNDEYYYDLCPICQGRGYFEEYSHTVYWSPICIHCDPGSEDIYTTSTCHNCCNGLVVSVDRIRNTINSWLTEKEFNNILDNINQQHELYYLDRISIENLIIDYIVSNCH